MAEGTGRDGSHGPKNVDQENRPLPVPFLITNLTKL